VARLDPGNETLSETNAWRPATFGSGETGPYLPDGWPELCFFCIAFTGVNRDTRVAARAPAKGPTALAAESGATVGRSDRDQAPGGVVSAGVQATVTVAAVDVPQRLVSFQGPKGEVRQVKAGQGVQIEKLKVGDRLLATYVETVAIRLEKLSPGRP
jgi:hypothetical protein